MGKEAASLYIAIKVASAAARKELQNFYAVAGNESRRAGQTQAQATRESIRQDGIRAREAAKTQREIAKGLLDEQKLIREIMRTRSLAWQQEQRENRQREREARQNRPKASAFAQAIYTSRFNAGGGASPLVGRTLDALGVGRSPIAGGALLLSGMALSQMRKGVELAGDLEQSLNLLKVTSNASDQELQSLAKTARDLGADLSLPATSSLDAAKAMLELSKAGLSVKDTQDAARGALELSAAAQIDAAEAAKIIGTQLRAFNLEGKEAGRISDLLAATANSTASDIGDLAEAAQQSSASFAAAKRPIEDMYTALGLLANNGIKGSDAGTSLKTMLARLNPTTKEAKQAMDALGISTYDAQGQMRPLQDIIAQFSAVLPTLTQKQRDWAIQTIFGSDAQRAANIVLSAGSKQYEDLKKKVTEAGAGAKLAEAQTKGYKGALEGLKSTQETFLEKAGTPFLGFLTEAIKLLSNTVGWLDDYTEKTFKATGVNLDLAKSLKAVNETMALNKKAAEQDATLKTDPRKRNVQDRIRLGQLESYQKHLASGGTLFDFYNKASKNGGFEEASSALDQELGTDRTKDTAQSVAAAANALRSKLDAELKQLQGLAKVTASDGVVYDPLRGAFEAEGRRKSAAGTIVPKKNASAAISQLQNADDERARKRATREAEQRQRREESIRERQERQRIEAERLASEAATKRAELEKDSAQKAYQLDLTRLREATSGNTINTLSGELAAGLRGSQSASYAAADAAYKTESARKAGDTEIIAQRRRELASAQRDGARRAADDTYRQKMEELNAAIRDARERQAKREEELADIVSEDVRARSEALLGFLKNEEMLLDSDKNSLDSQEVAMASSKEFASWYKKRTEVAKILYQNAVDQLQATRDMDLREMQARALKQYRIDKELMGEDGAYKRYSETIDREGRRIGASYSAGLTMAGRGLEADTRSIGMKQAERLIRTLYGDQQGFGDAPIVGPSAEVIARENGAPIRGMDRFSRDPVTGQSYDVTRWNSDFSGQRQVDMAQVYAMRGVQSSVSQRGEGFFRDLLQRPGDAGSNLMKGIATDFGNTLAETLRMKLIDGPLDNWFEEQANKLSEGIKIGGKDAGAAIGQAASLLMIAVAASGKQGKRKQFGTILGGALGFAVGGFGGAQVGATLGAMFTPRAGGGPLLPGRSYVFEGDRPEVVVMGSDGTGHVATGGSGGRAFRETGGSSSMQVNINGPIYERSDADYLLREIDDRRRRQERVR